MTQTDSYVSKTSTQSSSGPAAAAEGVGEDVGCRAADLSSDRYVELEHEARTSRFERAVTRAQQI